VELSSQLHNPLRNSYQQERGGKPVKELLYNLKRVCGPVERQGIWRISTTHALQELYIVADIKKKRLE
jgi:hypothetical protein